MTQHLHAVVYALVALWLLTGAGNWFCRQLFALTGLTDATAGGGATHRAGWIIGWLERIIMAVGILAHSWEVLAAVVALKTVARFKELDDQRFAEYFLIGSLFSLFWAVLVTAGWTLYDGTAGTGLRSAIAALIDR